MEPILGMARISLGRHSLDQLSFGVGCKSWISFQIRDWSSPPGTGRKAERRETGIELTHLENLNKKGARLG